MAVETFQFFISVYLLTPCLPSLFSISILTSLRYIQYTHTHLTFANYFTAQKSTVVIWLDLGILDF